MFSLMNLSILAALSGEIEVLCFLTFCCESLWVLGISEIWLWSFGPGMVELFCCAGCLKWIIALSDSFFKLVKARLEIAWLACISLADLVSCSFFCLFCYLCAVLFTWPLLFSGDWVPASLWIRSADVLLFNYLSKFRFEFTPLSAVVQRFEGSAFVCLNWDLSTFSLWKFRYFI